MTEKQDMGVVTPSPDEWELAAKLWHSGNPILKIAMVLARHRLASQADQGRDMFEAGYMAMWSEAHVKGAIKLPELNDSALDRAWDIYLATHPQPSQKGEGDE